MKPLPESFTHDGFTLRQLVRAGDVVLLEKSKAGHAEETYEVVIVQHHSSQTIHGREYPERESMPPTESWGVLGWSYSDLDAAKTRFDELVAARGDAPLHPTPFPNGVSEAAGHAAPNTPPSASAPEKG